MNVKRWAPNVRFPGILPPGARYSKVLM